jgi:hypothetical protein
MASLAWVAPLQIPYQAFEFREMVEGGEIIVLLEPSGVVEAEVHGQLEVIQGEAGLAGTGKAAGEIVVDVGVLRSQKTGPNVRPQAIFQAADGGVNFPETLENDDVTGAFLRQLLKESALERNVFLKSFHVLHPF